MLELLNQVIREQSMLDLINRSACLVGDRRQATPDEQGAANMIALNAGLATKDTGFNSSQLL